MKNNLLVQLLQDEKFRSTYEDHVLAGDIVPWDASFWERIEHLHVFSGFAYSLIDVFENECHIGTCLETSTALSLLFDRFELHRGICKILINTPGAPNGEHAWLEVDGWVYDTSLMIKIKKQASEQLGYISLSMENEYDLLKTKAYCYLKQRSLKDNSWYLEFKVRHRKFEQEFLKDL